MYTICENTFSRDFLRIKKKIELNYYVSLGPIIGWIQNKMHNVWKKWGNYLKKVLFAPFVPLIINMMNIRDL